MTNTELAYLAGLIDGEGTIYLYRDNKAAKDHGYRAYLEIGNRDPKMVMWLQARLGGRVYEQNRRGNRARCFSWRLMGVAAITVLEQALPYLITKAKHAEAMLQFRETLVAPGHKLPPDKRDRRVELVNRLRRLNRKGPKTEVLVDGDKLVLCPGCTGLASPASNCMTCSGRGFITKALADWLIAEEAAWEANR